MASPLHRYGAKPDPPDERDYKVHFPAAKIPTHGTKKALREFVPFVYNQGDLESCTANAVCAAYGMELKKEGKEYFEPSRLFVYYNTREIEGTTSENRGASIRNALKAMKNKGSCREKVPSPYWPYDKSKFAKKPQPECYAAATGNTVSKYERLTIDGSTDIHQIRACLDQCYPLVFGFKVFKQSFEDKARLTGIMGMPGPGDEHVGNHAVVAVGYNDGKKRVIVLNSWGPHWGDNGYFYMPYEFIASPKRYCFDFWKIEFATETRLQARIARKAIKEAWTDDTLPSNQNPPTVYASSRGHRAESECQRCCTIV